ncbi:MAG: aminotransferase class I/II-fold pyridoxal phosphate-dependent enzyme [Bacteroidales bacterium]|jgi:LL-diaminopimelate aminotransferase|nr:aminotransferase class I/II-fold pyridoxal phosphate-dependent enzyme [Bacteroidales bacterium]
MKPIRPAERLNNVSEYYFSKKLKEVAALNAAGKNIISLGIGSPDLPPSPEAIKVLADQAALPNTHGYQPYNGLPELRRAFATWYQTWYGVTLNPDTEIQPLIGSKEGILHISMAFLNPGDGVLVPNPGYPTYASVTQLVQAEAFTYKLLPENGWEPDFDALEAMDLSRVKLMWVNYPNMPTGAKASMVLFEKLVDFGRRHGIVICNDNPYSFILNEDYLSLLKVPGALEGCIELNSMSKSHNMPGWRIGMLATNPTFLQWIMQVKSNVDSGQFRPMQLAAVEALKADKTWYAGMNAVYKRRRLLAEAILKALGCSWDPAQSGLFLWGRVPENGLDGAALSDKVLYEANVFITPGFIFGSQGERYVRLSLCCTEENLAKALERVSALH